MFLRFAPFAEWEAKNHENIAKGEPKIEKMYFTVPICILLFYCPDLQWMMDTGRWIMEYGLCIMGCE